MHILVATRGGGMNIIHIETYIKEHFVDDVDEDDP